MAQYHYHQSFVQRSRGSSVVAHAAYIAGDRIVDARSETKHDYRAKKHVIVSKIVAPPSAEAWVYQRDTLWNAVEAFEDDLAHRRFRGHKDADKHERSLKAREDYLNRAQTGLKVRGSLPLELTLEQSQEAVETFLTQRFVSRGLVVDYALHWESGNPHFHALVTLRRVEGTTFSTTKDSDICTKDNLKDSRKLWEEIGNQALEKAGRPERWTCHSYKDLGIDVVATTHRGWYADHLLNKEQPCRIALDNEDKRQQNLKIFLDKPEEIIKIVAQHHTVFTQKHVEKEIMKRVGHDQVLLEILQKKCAAVLEQQATVSWGGGFSDDLSSHDPSSPGTVSQGKASKRFSSLTRPSSFPYLGRNANDNLMFEGRFEDFQKRTVSAYAQALLSQTDPDHPTLDGKLTDIIPLGPTVKRQASYIRGMDQQREKRIIETLEKLLSTSVLTIHKDQLTPHIQAVETAEAITFSHEQRVAIEHLHQASQITVLTGRAGTGKTTLLKPLAQAYQEAGYRVRGTAFQGKVADLLTRELGIASRTLDAFETLFKAIDDHEKRNEKTLRGKALSWAQRTLTHTKKHDLNERDVIIMDEANMVHSKHWDMLLERVAKSGAKLIVVQDPSQIKPLFGADISRILDEKATPALLTTVHRQQEAWMREASVAFNHHNLLEGLKAYEERGHVHFKDTLSQAHNALIADYVNTLVDHPNQTTKIITFQNKDVYTFNSHVQHHLKQRGDLGEAFEIHQQTFYVGDHIMFTQNTTQATRCLDLPNKRQSIFNADAVKNGTFGVIEAFKDDTVKVRLGDGRLIGFNRHVYQSIQLGYAMTVNKAEGETFDRVLGYADTRMSPNQWLILGTRHRHALNVYGSQEHAPTLKHLAHLAGNSDDRPLISDYTLTPATQPYFDKVQRYDDLWQTLSETLHGLNLEDPKTNNVKPLTSKETLKKVSQAEKVQASEHIQKPYSLWESYALLKENQKALALDIYNNWEACQPFAKQLGLKKQTLAHEAGLDTKPLSPLEDEARVRVGLYRKLASETRALWTAFKESPSESLMRDRSNHPLYEDYVKHKQARNTLAYDIHTHFDLHKPFLKMDKVLNTQILGSPSLDSYSSRSPSSKASSFLDTKETSQEKKYVYKDACDQVFDHPSHGKASIEKHSQDHIQSLKHDVFMSRLSDSHKKDLEMVKTYKHHASMQRRLYHDMKDRQATLSPQTLDAYKRELQTIAHTRDMMAFRMVENYERYERFLKPLNITPDTVLNHATLGEIRLTSEAYMNAHTTEDHRKAAFDLKNLIDGADGNSYHKVYYGVSRARVDMKRLTFDCAAYQADPDLSLNEVKAAYTDLRTYRAMQKESSDVWTVIQASAIAHVQGLQDKVISEHLMYQGMKRQTIEKAVMEEFSCKQVNDTVLQETSHRILKAVKAIGPPSFPPTLNTTTREAGEKDEGVLTCLQELYYSHSMLQERRSSYLSLSPQKEAVETWKRVKEPKLLFSYTFCTRHSKILSSLPTHEQTRLKKEALAFEATPMIQRYEKSEAHSGTNLSGTDESRTDLSGTDHFGTHQAGAHALRTDQTAHAHRPFHSRNKVNVKDLITLFNENMDMERLAQNLLGQPKSLRGHELEYKGGLKVNIHKRVWHDFSRENQEGAAYGLIKAYTHCRGSKSILRYGLEFVNTQGRYPIETYITGAKDHDMSQEDKQRFRDEQKTVKHTREREAAQKVIEHKNKIKSVHELYEKSLSIKGTQAETYLRDQRHITLTPSDDIRYFKAFDSFTYQGIETSAFYGALLAFARDEKGDLSAVQITSLKKGKKYVNKEGQSLKKTYGAQAGSYVSIQKGTYNRVAFLAEGVETALSLKEAGVHASIYAGLGMGNMANFNLKYRTVILCADYDGVDAKTSQTIREKAKKLEDQGYNVVTIWPARTGEAKIDFNDILTLQGKEKLALKLKTETENLPVFTELTHQKKNDRAPSIQKQNKLER